MKKILTIILTFGVLISAVGLCACVKNEQDEQGLVFYLQDDGTYSVDIGNAKELSKIVIPATYNGKAVTKIKENFANGSKQLTEITIPDSVKTIGKSAFYYCETLTKVTIGDIDSWCEIEFSGYYSNPLYYAKNLYINDTLVTEVNITKATKINAYAFYNCSSLTVVTIGNSVKEIGSSAFYNCSSLTSVTIGDKVTSIGSSAFNCCKSLTSVTIGDNVTSIGNYAFGYCQSLTSISIPNSVTSIGEKAFEDCSSLTVVTIGDSVKEIGWSAFKYCSSITKVNYTGDIDSWCEIEFGIYYSNPLYYAKNLYINDTLVTEANITKATKINAYAFSNCSLLTSVTISNSVTSIGEKAFEDCKSFTSITIPNSVKKIGGFAFWNCSSITKVNYTGDIDSWCEIEFGNSISNSLCYAKNLYINNTLVTEVNITKATKINAYAFYDCKSLTSITIGKNVKEIGNETFSYCSSLTSITIGEATTSIGNEAFFNCKSLNNITVNVNNNAFKSIYGNLYSKDGKELIQYAIGKSNTTFSVPNNVESIGSYAFSDCSSLTSITVPNSVKEIGNYAFSGCSSLTSITVPNSVKKIGDGVFYFCLSLESITIPDSVKEIGSYAFCDCSSLTEVTIGDSVKEIGWGAFRYCSSLTSITIGDKVTSIGYYAFEYCSSLTSITFSDSSNWYRTNNSTNFENKTGGTLTNLSNPSTNATYFASYYYYCNYYWYKLDS